MNGESYYNNIDDAIEAIDNSIGMIIEGVESDYQLAKKLEFEKKDEGFLSLVKKYLWEDKATEMAGYKIDHPEVGKPVFILRTKGKNAKKSKMPQDKKSSMITFKPPSRKETIER